MKEKKNILEFFIGALISGILNGIIKWYQVDTNEVILLTKDSITSDQNTVIGASVGLAVSMAFILTTISFFTSKIPNKPSYFPKVFLLAGKHSIYAFGVIVILGVLIQNFFGSVELSRMASAITTGLIALIVAYIVNYETEKNLQYHS